MTKKTSGSGATVPSVSVVDSLLLSPVVSAHSVPPDMPSPAQSLGSGEVDLVSLLPHLSESQVALPPAALSPAQPLTPACPLLAHSPQLLADR